MRSIRLAAIFLLAVSWLGAMPGHGADAPSMSARIDGKPWVATHSTAITFRFGPQPALNIAGYLDGPPTSKLNLNLVLSEEDQYAGEFALGPAAGGVSNGNFTLNVMDLDAIANAFALQSCSVVVRYDAVTQTVSGSFSGIAANPAKTRTVQISDGSFAAIPVLGGR